MKLLYLVEAEASIVDNAVAVSENVKYPTG